MAGRRDETRLGGIGAFGILEGAGQFLGPVGDTLFELFLGFDDRLRRLPFGGDIGKGNHETTVGHFLRKDRQDMRAAPVNFES